MKKIIIILMSVLSSSAYAIDSYYVSGQVGLNHLSNNSMVSHLGNGVEVGGSVSFDSKIHGGFAFGRQIDKMRYEIEYQYGRLGIDGVSLGAVSKRISAKGDYQTLMTNAYYSHELNEKISGFVGMGLGWGKQNLPSIGLIPNCNCVPESSKDGFAYQAKLGFEYKVDKNQQVGVQYTALKLPKPSGNNINHSSETINIFGVTYRRLF